MAKSKVISSGKMTPVRGGTGHMFGKQHVGTKKPGVTGKVDSGGTGKWIKGGSGKMFGKQTSTKAKAR
jgi:hypothetical protein